MIIDEENNFIFVHVYRTGGSSMDAAFGGCTAGVATHAELNSIPDWKNYFSFGFVRNPWDRTVSSYMYQIIREQFEGTFEEYVRQFAVGELRTSKQFAQYNMVKDCSYIGRFEHLRNDFNEACKLSGIENVYLPHAWKTDHEHYSEYYNDELKQIVKDSQSGDIDHFGFSFNSTATKNIGLIR